MSIRFQTLVRCLYRHVRLCGCSSGRFLRAVRNPQITLVFAGYLLCIAGCKGNDLGDDGAKVLLFELFWLWVQSSGHRVWWTRIQHSLLVELALLRQFGGPFFVSTPMLAFYDWLLSIVRALHVCIFRKFQMFHMYEKKCCISFKNSVNFPPKKSLIV